MSLTMKIGRWQHAVASYADASNVFCAMRDRLGRGASGTPTPLIYEAESVVAHVSYNGRVWPGSPKDWRDGLVPLFDPRSA